MSMPTVTYNLRVCLPPNHYIASQQHHRFYSKPLTRGPLEDSKYYKSILKQPKNNTPFCVVLVLLKSAYKTMGFIMFSQMLPSHWSSFPTSFQILYFHLMVSYLPHQSYFCFCSLCILSPSFHSCILTTRKLRFSGAAEAKIMQQIGR